MAATRHYIVEQITEQPSQERIIRATNQAQALGHATRTIFRCRVATTNDMARLLPKGVAVEQATADRDDALNQANLLETTPEVQA